MLASSRSSRRSTVAEVGQDELELEHRRVAQGVDRAVRVGNGVRLERSHHVDERVHAAQRRQVHEGRALALGDARDVDVLDGGERPLLRLVDLGEPLDPRVGDAGDADPRLGPPPGGAAGVPVRSWKSVLLPARESPRMPAFMERLYAGRSRPPALAPGDAPV